MGLVAAFAGACAIQVPIDGLQGQGKLERVTNKASGEGAGRGLGQRPQRGLRSHWQDDERDDSDGLMELLFGEFLSGFTVVVFGSPFWVPHSIMEEQPGEMDWASFQSHPYDLPDQPFLGRFGATGGGRKSVSFRTSFEYGTDFDDIERLAMAAHIETAVRFGLEGSWSHYREDLGAGGTDTLNLGDANVTYRFAQAGYGEMRTGIGVNWFGDGSQREAGLNFTYGGDFFPADPWVLAFELDAGTVGDANRFHGRANVGVLLDRFELTAGFDYESLDAVTLPMWTVGMRVWF